MPVKVRCDQCSKVLLRNPSALNRRPDNLTYCSRECRSAYREAHRADRFWSKVDRNGSPQEHCPELGPCWIWTAARLPAGYGLFGIPSRGAIKSPAIMLKAHRYAYELTRGPIPDNLWVLHRCDNPPCVNPDHLFLGTATDNNRDTKGKGRWRTGSITKPERLRRGVAHYEAKLTDSMVREIRGRYLAGGVTGVALAKEYGVSNAALYKVLQGRSWKHVT